MYYGTSAKVLRLEAILNRIRVMVENMECQVEWFHVKRKKNSLADSQANLAIQLRKKGFYLINGFLVNQPIH